MGDTLIFFRALSQDDQDDIHLKLEDIIQVVSSPVVLSSTTACKLPLQGKQRAYLITERVAACSAAEALTDEPDLVCRLAAGP